MRKQVVGLLLLGVAATGARGELAGNTNASFYSDLSLFSTRADETKAVQSIDRLGPVGIGIELHQPRRPVNSKPGRPSRP